MEAGSVRGIFEMVGNKYGLLVYRFETVRGSRVASASFHKWNKLCTSSTLRCLCDGPWNNRWDDVVPARCKSPWRGTVAPMLDCIRVPRVATVGNRRAMLPTWYMFIVQISQPNFMTKLHERGILCIAIFLYSSGTTKISYWVWRCSCTLHRKCNVIDDVMMSSARSDIRVSREVPGVMVLNRKGKSKLHPRTKNYICRPNSM